jgi:hypothetical protein
LCSSCKTPRFHGDPKDQYKFYNMDSDYSDGPDEPDEKYKTDNP